jgi:signal transduction histidine kinase
MEKLRILVVDDEEVVRNICSLSLRKLDCVVEEAENGIRAIEKMRAQPAEIVITDLKMPAMGGMELLETLKRDWPFVEVVIMTGFATIESAIEAMKKGAYDFILKPLKADQIRMVVEKCRQKIALSKENEELRIANQKLREVEEMKNKFIAITSHELRTPVTHLKGYLSILSEDASELSERERAECMEVIHRALDDLEEIVVNMYDVLNLEQPSHELQKDRVDIHDMIRQVVSEFRLTTRKRNLHLAFEPAGDELQVMADRLRLKTMLAELVQNAIKFTPDGGTITIRTGKESPYCTISVIDTGVGIPPEEQGRIFEKFYEVQNSDLHSSSKTGFMGGGIGLGLALARSIAEAHGGGIRVESHVGKGSEFRVYLPLVEG